LDINWNSLFGKLATLNRQAEWDEFVAKFQITKPGATSFEKRKLMERIFSL